MPIVHTHFVFLTMPFTKKKQIQNHCHIKGKSNPPFWKADIFNIYGYPHSRMKNKER